MNPAVLAFLLHFHCVPTAQVLVEPALPAKGAYSRGVVYLRPDADDGVLVHELYHDCQYQRGGTAADGLEWYNREREAAKVERAWREE